MIVAANVEAKVIYTDYTFEGYTYEEKENTDIYKYEKTKLNKFYKKIETDSTYLESDPEGLYDAKDEDDTKIEYVYMPHMDDPRAEDGYVILRSTDNSMISKVQLRGITEYRDVHLKEIEVYDGDRQVEVDSPGNEFLFDKDLTAQALKTSTIDIVLSEPVLANDIKFKIYYENGESFYLTYAYFDETDNQTFSSYFPTSSNVDNISVRTVDVTTFEQYVEKLDYNPGKKIFGCGFNRTLYRYYNIEKEYYKTSEDKFIEGYTYDEEESIIAYKTYKREKLIVEDPPIEIPPKEETGNDEYSSEEEPKGTTATEPKKEPVKKVENSEKKNEISKVTEIEIKEYASKNEIGEAITDEQIKRNAKDEEVRLQDVEASSCICPKERLLIIGGAILVVLLLIYTLYKLCVNTDD